jgi:3-methyladenine DNA glycosylase AlkD
VAAKDQAHLRERARPRALSKRERDRLVRDTIAELTGGWGVPAAMKARRARWVGWELINKHSSALALLDLAKIEALGAGNSSWDEVDGYAIYVSGAAWLRGRIRDADVRRWTQSPDLWRRRAALVSTVVLNTRVHGGRGDTKRTLDIARRLVDDREDMVVKAMSWALRALVPWDRVAVENFLAEHDTRLAARVKRETRTKLRTGKKNG